MRPRREGERTSERRRFGVVPGGDEEGSRDIDADAGEVEQGVGPSPDQGSELGVEPAHHGVQCLMAAEQRGERDRAAAPGSSTARIRKLTATSTKGGWTSVGAARGVPRVR